VNIFGLVDLQSFLFQVEIANGAETSMI
jgi:hypothetical protein